MAKKMVKEIMVYKVDDVDGVPIYAVATSLGEIPEDVDGQIIGIYVLSREDVFRMRRFLQSKSP